MDKLGSPLRAVENYDSYECRSRNRIPGAKLSEHAHGDAIDVRALDLADGRRLELTDATVDQPLRSDLRETAVCQWDVREPPSTKIAARVPLPMPRPLPYRGAP